MQKSGLRILNRNPRFAIRKSIEPVEYSARHASASILRITLKATRSVYFGFYCTAFVIKLPERSCGARLHFRVYSYTAFQENIPTANRASYFPSSFVAPEKRSFRCQLSESSCFEEKKTIPSYIARTWHFPPAFRNPPNYHVRPTFVHISQSIRSRWNCF